MDLKPMGKNEYYCGDEIIIYGAGLFGEIAYRGLCYLGIPVSWFCDRTLDGTKRFGIAVISPKDLSDHLGAKVIIATQNYFREMMTNLEEMGFKCCYDIRNFFDFPLDEEILSPNAKDMFDNPEKYRDAVAYSYLSSDDIYIPHLEVVVTERCTLKCKGCSNMSPYYERPQNIYLSECIEGIERLFNIVTYISEIRLLGGEPFVNPRIDEFIIKFVDCAKVGIIHIYTNGTIIPQLHVLKALKNEKVHVHISNYGINNEQIKKLIHVLQEENILYTEREYDYWVDLGETAYKNYSDKKRKEIFRSCIAKTCFTLLRNKLFRCSRAANLYNMQCCEDLRHEYVDLGDKLKIDKELEANIKEIFWEIDDLDACNYCNGMDLFHNKIPVAEQMV